MASPLWKKGVWEWIEEVGEKVETQLQYDQNWMTVALSSPLAKNWCNTIGKSKIEDGGGVSVAGKVSVNARAVSQLKGVSFKQACNWSCSGLRISDHVVGLFYCWAVPPGAVYVKVTHYNAFAKMRVGGCPLNRSIRLGGININ